jgi:hypothetical protein
MAAPLLLLPPCCRGCCCSWRPAPLLLSSLLSSPPSVQDPDLQQVGHVWWINTAQPLQRLASQGHAGTGITDVERYQHARYLHMLMSCVCVFVLRTAARWGRLL